MSDLFKRKIELFSHQERRQSCGRRSNDDHSPPCAQLTMTGENMNTMIALLEQIREDMQKKEQENKESFRILQNELLEIKLSMASKKGFLHGAKWMFTAIMLAAVWLVDKLWPNFKW